MQTQTTENTSKEKISGRDLHKYIWLLVGVFALLTVTYPTSMMRVSQKEKFKGFHVKSLPIEGKYYSGSAK
ncbi:MAG: hypothetical protein ACK513_09215 [Aphanizomenon sp.]|jgi:hypothetical protein|uniref:Uncharacterized protein n=1 Tax=Aphanizomenon flos-aquae LD13 TaxID=1710894 RepID=A0A1B7W0X4_APHFL|nr:hypothetical protein [Aphanizomenon flos-aquae UKL13-PB]MBO1060416.1 hypothetical protein [Aphanizomenon flos-aquae CP01]OBQ26927.1 MAG: hypothetical protein AN481_02425 [Aphanizomenon flos-aquae LD13]OBQ28445.1 MAG: hypothetical protein AN483_15630 [Aphanizomenon flos-aquae MDT14a]QSV67766.1 MAG: hypothetical protein HEQ12_13130 [Aphanizomenon flos-aquae DEX188]HCQ23462.1 hypothetical protein [Anabaena sp. UBA12330]